MIPNKTLITTHTGEPSQPVRIYYQVVKPKTVLGVFKKLRCVYWEKPLQRWRWAYEHEAQKLRFERSYSKIPKEAKPVVIGEFFWRGEQELWLEVRSFERAIKALEFFARRINPRAAQATKLRVVNRFFAAEEPNVEQLLESPYDSFFDGDEVDIPDPEQLLKEAQEVKQSQKTQEGSTEPWIEYLEAKLQEKTPEIEEIPLGFYREEGLGLEGLEMALSMRKLEAAQHFAGNESFSQYELIEKMTESLLEMLPEERTAQLQGTKEEE